MGNDAIEKNIEDRRNAMLDATFTTCIVDGLCVADNISINRIPNPSVCHSQAQAQFSI